ncbi:MAG: S9 family peptidase [Oscillospiraceae bacterium]|jgi:dipeptidyl aminopeptidase/acylaminoacyl peptidase|nr:S9 family peptidase [Oscillospiraceae bacterium]
MPERITLDFFAKCLYPSHLKSLDDTLYFIGKRGDMERNVYDSEVYRLSDGKPIQLTSSQDVQDYALTKCGIVFASARSEKDKADIKRGVPLTVFQCLPYGGGEAREILRLPYKVLDIEWLPDNKALFRAVLDHRLNALLDENGGDIGKALNARKELDESVTVIDELPFWFNGQGLLSGKRTALYLWNGSESVLLTDSYANAGKPSLNAARTKALFTQQVYRDKAPRFDTLMELDVPTKTVRTVHGVAEGYVGDSGYGPDGLIYYTFTAPGGPHGDHANPRLTRVNADGTHETLDQSPDAAYNYGNSVGSDSKLGSVNSGLVSAHGEIAFLSTIVDDSHIEAYDLSAKSIRQITAQPGLVAEFIPWRDGYAAVAMRGNGLSDIYEVSLDGSENRLSDLNGELLSNYTLPTPEPLYFMNKNGVEIHGWVIPPVEWPADGKAPAILDIHGGPKTVYGSVFFHEMQYWSGQGYAVMFCNPTGGDGRGDEFADLRAKYGTIDYDDIMGFVDAALLKYPAIDPERLGVTGGSYGGFMTNWIIGHTDRFKAAATQRSIASWLSFANISDIGHTFGSDQMGGTPWTNPEEFWRASPIKYATAFKTPTLVLHSDEDYRCPLAEGLQLYYALKVMDVPAKLVIFKGENHELSRSGKPKNRVRRLKEITEWMDRFLKG